MRQSSKEFYLSNINSANLDKAMPNLKEGDFAMTAHGGDEEFHIGQVVHVMRDGMLGIPGGEYTLKATPENPAVLIQLFEQDEDGLWEATRTYSACMMSLFIAIDPLPVEPELTVEDVQNTDAYDNSIGKVDCCPEDIEKKSPCWDGYVQRGMKQGDNGQMVPNCVPVEKADGESENPIMPTQTYQGCECDQCILNNTSCDGCSACGGKDAETEMKSMNTDKPQDQEAKEEVKQESFFNFRDLRPVRNVVQVGDPNA